MKVVIIGLLKNLWEADFLFIDQYTVAYYLIIEKEFGQWKNRTDRDDKQVISSLGLIKACYCEM